MLLSMLKRFLHIRKGEAARVALCFLILMLVVGAHTVVKAVRDAIFLTRFDVSDLSLIAIGLAVFIGLIVSGYLRITSGLARNRIILATNLLVALSLVVLWLGFETSNAAGWIAWVLYIWSSVFIVFILVQFWLLAGDLFNVREAKRLYGLVGAGAIVGGLSGGLLAQKLATHVGTAGLLLLAAGMVLAAGGLSHAVWRLCPDKADLATTDTKQAVGGLLDWISHPSYARLLGGVLLVATMVTTLLDWQFKAAAKHEFAGRTDEMAAFFGSLYFYVSLVSILLQVGVTSWLLRRFGIGAGLRVLPSILIAGAATILSVGLLPLTLLTALAGTKIIEGGVRFTIDKASMELTWLPLPKAIRERGKVIVDTVVDRLGTGLTGVLWLVMAAFGLDDPGRIHWISVLLLVLGALWLVVVVRANGAYLDMFRESLAQRTLDLGTFYRSLGNAEARRTLTSALKSPEPGEVCFALYLLRETEPTQLPELDQALSHPEPSVRIEALDLLAGRHDRSHRGGAISNLSHDDARVRFAAVHLLAQTAAGPDERILGELSGEDAESRMLRTLLSARSDAPSRVLAEVRSLVKSVDKDTRVSLIRLLGAAPSGLAGPALRPFLDGDDSQTVRTAIRAVGRSGAIALVPDLAEKLEIRRWRPHAISALRDMGDAALEILASRMVDPHTSVEVRRAIIRLAGAGRDPRVAESLSQLLGQEPIALSHAALQALTRLQSRVSISVGGELVRELVISETESILRDLAFLGRGAWPSAREASSDEDFLARAVREGAGERLKRIFRLLSLLHSSQDIVSISRGLKSSSTTRRANSLEFLDNLLDASVKRLLLPVIEENSPNQIAALVNRLLDDDTESREQAIARMLSGPDRWLQVVAAQTAGDNALEHVSTFLERLVSGEDDELSKVAQRAISRLSADEMEGVTMGLTVVEKALKLQNVDVLQRASSEDLAYVAQIAEEVELAVNEHIYTHGDTPDALYVVISGHVRLHRGDAEIAVIGTGEAFGTWALFDEAPRVASATTVEPTTLLKVDRDEFLELLADRVDIAQAIFKAMVERIRNLARLAGI